ncbi:Concanavalin A-like lectin/glucanase, subgroup [Phaffia rhodozyma]|uniref:Concanavalin A-like lectin/glucanase, subgroup n=1 Tax=Phaffia rhodozyma TaxID=264483 RepID=A0A0F7SVL2_PHARH|nr:Concanavalin A-like lectin/glucanase, subgroup [Phaffia rhodozyma]
MGIQSIVALATFASVAQATSYTLAKTYSGSTFFDDWSYYGNYDNLTLGDVTWVNRTVADANPELTYVNDAGNAIIKVDNTSTVAYNYKRDSVRITSLDYISVGSVWVLDATHVPYGCSVWPAFWSTGPNWPYGGEIDTFEGVNQVTYNQNTLHTTAGCTQASSVNQTGITTSSDCDYSVDSNAGCAVIDNSTTNTYGEGFASAGGGAWVTEMATEGINIWFFSRADIPSAVSNANSSIDTSALGTPVASWPKSSCDIDSHFSAQQLVFDITLCGSWAGEASIIAETCDALVGTDTCYTTYVLNSTNYDQAYFEIKSVKVYGSVSTTFTNTTGDSTSSSSSTSSSVSSSARERTMEYGVVVSAGVLSLLGAMTLFI